jgi:hypothetical protein
MIRKFEDGFKNDMKFAAVVVSKDGNVFFLHRDKEGDQTLQDGPRAITFPCYVRVTASKIPVEPGVLDFLAEFSSDGINWTVFSSTTKIPMDGRLMAGLVASAQLGKTIDTTTDQAHAKFSNVSVVPAVSNVVAAPDMDNMMPMGGH